jgi:hypothetical protein
MLIYTGQLSVNNSSQSAPLTCSSRSSIVTLFLGLTWDWREVDCAAESRLLRLRDGTPIDSHREMEVVCYALGQQSVCFWLQR